MARATNVALSKTYVKGMYVNGDGEKSPFSFEFDGIVKEARARILLKKKLGTSNFFMFPLAYDTSKVSLDAETFFENSLVCYDGVSYDRGYAVQTLKITTLKVEIFDLTKITEDTEVHFFERLGEYTETRNRKFLEDAIGHPNFIFTTTVREEKRYMTKEKYMELAVQ